MIGWLRALVGRKSTPITHPSELWEIVGPGATSSSGVHVSPSTALQVSAVLACVRVLAEGVSQVPWKVYRQSGDTRTPATDHPVYRLLHSRPNPVQTSFEFREQLMLHAVLTGNAFVYINRVGGRVVELLPLEPGEVSVMRRPDRTLTYSVMIEGRAQEVPPRSIWHIRGPTWNGYEGLHAVKLAREAIGLAMATEGAAGSGMRNGNRLSGVLESDGRLSDDAVRRLRETWEATYSGRENAGKTAILEEGLKFKAVSMSARDAELMEQRRFQLEEVARVFRVYPAMIGVVDRGSSYASVEQFFLAHVVHTLGPWFRRLEESADAALLADEDDLYTKFTVLGLLRGDAKSRAEFYSKGILDGWLTRNEARGFEDLNPLDGLDEPLQPLNMGSGDGATDQIPAENAQ